MSTNYSKWENIDGAENDDEVVAEIEDKRVYLQRNKRIADEAFSNAESEGSEGMHRGVLAIYDKLLSDIEDCSKHSTLDVFLRDLFISCQLNCACCHIRLRQWKNALKYCNTVFTSQYFSKLKAFQLIRFSYFKCLSLVRSNEDNSKDSVATIRKELEVFRELLKNYSDSEEGISMQKTPEYKKQLYDYQLLFNECEDLFSASLTPLSVPSSSGDKTTQLTAKASKLLQAKKYEEAISEYLSLIEAHSVSFIVLSDNQLTEVYNNLTQAYTSLGNHKKAADALMLSINHMTSSNSDAVSVDKEKVAVCLKAAAMYYKLKLFDDATSAYKASLEVIDPHLTIHDSDGTSSSSDNNVNLLYHIGRAGLAATYVATRSNLTTAYEYLVIAVNYFENHVFTNISSSSVGNLLHLLQHLCNSYDSLGNCCMILATDCSIDTIQQKHHDNCDYLCDRTIDTCNAMLYIVDTTKHSTTSTETVKLLRTRRAYSYYAKAKLYAEYNLTYPNIVSSSNSNNTSKKVNFNNDINDVDTIKVEELCRQITFPLPIGKYDSKHTTNCSAHTVIYESIDEATMTFFEFAGVEYSSIDNYQLSFNCYKSLGDFWMKCAHIEPFKFERTNDENNAIDNNYTDDASLEKGYEVWRKAALICDKILAILLKQQAHIDSEAILQDIHFYQQQSLLTLFNAGLFAIQFNKTDAQRAFKAALSVRDVINSASSTMSKPNDYFITIGDVSYHLAQVYVRCGKFEYAATEAKQCIYYYHYCDMSAQDTIVLPLPEGLSREQWEDLDRVRVRQAYGLLAVAYSCSNRIKDAEIVLQHIKKSCIGPIEDGDKEVEAVRRQIEQRKPKEVTATPTPTVASFNNNNYNAADSDTTEEPPMSNMRLEKVETEEPKVVKFIWLRKIVYRVLERAIKSPTFRWTYKKVKPFISLVMSIIYSRRGGSEIRNDNDSSTVSSEVASKTIDYNMLIAYSILGAVLGIVIGIVVKVYAIIN